MKNSNAYKKKKKFTCKSFFCLVFSFLVFNRTINLLGKYDRLCNKFLFRCGKLEKIAFSVM